MKIRGVILAGGNSSRLYPATKSFTKHFLTIYDKPLIYYPLSTLMLAGVKDVLLICKKNEVDLYKKLLGNGDFLGISISYEIQEQPKGIAEALFICKKFVSNNKFYLILGDNLFFGTLFSKILNDSQKLQSKSACFFISEVENPSEFGVLKYGKKNIPTAIIEKPKKRVSNKVVTGMYLYKPKVFKLLDKIKPSKRGEYEISSINNLLLKNNECKIIYLNRGFTWLDTGNPDNLLQASQFVQAYQKRQGFIIACIEEIALNKKYITLNQFKKLINKYKNSDYGKYLKKIYETRKYKL